MILITSPVTPASSLENCQESEWYWSKLVKNRLLYPFIFRTPFHLPGTGYLKRDTCKLDGQPSCGQLTRIFQTEFVVQRSGNLGSSNMCSPGNIKSHVLDRIISRSDPEGITGLDFPDRNQLHAAISDGNGFIYFQALARLQQSAGFKGKLSLPRTLQVNSLELDGQRPICSLGSYFECPVEHTGIIGKGSYFRRNLPGQRLSTGIRNSRSLIFYIDDRAAFE